MQLTQEQKDGKNMILNWYKKNDVQKFTLAGYAGTGKTTLIKHIIEELKISKKEVAFATYTGKASILLKQNNPDYHTSTIHRLCYDVDTNSKIVSFILKDKRELNYLKLIIIDEYSMITDELYKDIMSFGIKVLFVGDIGQLPPIGKDNNAIGEPDFILTKIHRQAEENPVIYLSMQAREGKRIKTGKYGKEVLVINKSDINQKIEEKIFKSSGQIICGYNRTRKDLNNRIRSSLGFTLDQPQVGDKIICLKNNNKIIRDGIALTNGMIGKIDNIRDSNDNMFRENIVIDFKTDFMQSKYTKLITLESDYKTTTPVELDRKEFNMYERFDYGYAISCHKSQGSQFDNLVVYNEVLNSKTHNKWLYTAITRTKNNLVLII